MITGLTTGANRDKVYKELTQEEKIERAHQIIRNLILDIKEMKSDIHHLKKGLKNHSHHENEVVTPWSEYQETMSILGRIDNNNDYF